MAGEGPARDGSRGRIRASAIDRADHFAIGFLAM